MRASRSFVLTHNLQRATYNRSQEHTPRRQEHAATPLKRGPKIKSRRAVPARCAQVLRSDARVQVLRSYPPTTSNVQPISRAHSPSAGACRHPARAGILDQERKSGSGALRPSSSFQRFASTFLVLNPRSGTGTTQSYWRHEVVLAAEGDWRFQGTEITYRSPE